MGCFSLFALFLFALLDSSDVVFASSTGPDSGSENYIVGGSEVNITEYPYQAYLLLTDDVSDNYECGGSIISTRYILTAAHCFRTRTIVSLTARIGSSNKFFGGRAYDSRTWFTHPLYNSTNFDYDVALVNIPQGMELDGTSSRKIKLIKGMSNVPGGTIVNVSGWGNEAEDADASPQMLRAVQVPTLTNADCSTKLSNITPRILCAGLDEGGKDACQGDSGGPAVHDNIQVAIVSSGIGCARPDHPGQYTNITNYRIRDWIRTTSGV